jgi:hypothetical protein
MNGRSKPPVNAQATDTHVSIAEMLKSWLWVAAWTIAGAVAGTVLAYLLFGLAYTGWDAVTERLAGPKPERSGDPIDAWAIGIVGIMLAIPVVLLGMIGGAVAGFRFGRYRQPKKVPSYHAELVLIACLLRVNATEIPEIWTLPNDAIPFAVVTADSKLLGQPPRTLNAFIAPVEFQYPHQ